MIKSQTNQKTGSIQKERRKHTRTNIHLPVYFICIDNDGNEIVQDIAAILNISKSGILMESSHNLPGANYIRIMRSTKKNDTVEVRGKVVYSIKVGTDKFMIGISFQDTLEKIFKFIKNLSVVFA